MKNYNVEIKDVAAKNSAISDSPSLKLFLTRTLVQTSCLQATGSPLTFICNYSKVNTSDSDYFCIRNYSIILVTGFLCFYNLKMVFITKNKDSYHPPHKPDNH